MRTPAVLLFSLCVCLSAFGQTGRSISVSVAPEATLPLGANASAFSYGASGEFTGSLDGVLPVVSPMIAVGYDYVPLSTLGS